MPNLVTLDPQHIVIIGAGPDLGAAVARRYACEGFQVTLAGRREHVLAALADELHAGGARVDTLVADAGNQLSYRARLAEFAQHHAPGVVLYNAALLASDNILTSSTDYLASAYTVDVLGAITAAQVFTPAMRQAGTGTFLTTGGGLSLNPNPDFATISLGKAALRAATSLLHDELAPHNVHVTGITIVGNIAPETPSAPHLIADTYWACHVQRPTQWSAETIFDGH